jgi:cytochrome c oxidase assembly protein subunit 15
VLPLVYFAARRRISAPLARALIKMLLLGGLQGALGWFMVQSGLVDVPRVSPYRLSAHLALAVAIYGYVVWVAFSLLSGGARAPAPGRLRYFGIGFTALACAMILAGGFVAGTRAGHAFNTFPLMDGEFVPRGALALEPWWRNFFENIATVQFDHRALGYALVLAVFAYWTLAQRAALPAGIRRAFHLLLIATLAQAMLGVATLLWSVPVALGAMHQAGALAVLTVALYLNHALRVP